MHVQFYNSKKPEASGRGRIHFRTCVIAGGLRGRAMGDKHSGCAAKCIKGGGPVGIVSDGKAYLIVGDHKPMNDQLAEYAGKTITIKGKMAERGGVAMLENAEIVTK